MTEPVIAQKEPYRLKMQPGKYAWCACGKSSKQPFCDSSHKGSGFSPVIVEIEEEKQVSWCGCKRSGTKPYCDGTHRKF